MRSTRYRDMLFFRSDPRMTSVTAHPLWLKKIAACPAELPPPTTTTGATPHMRDSISVAA